MSTFEVSPGRLHAAADETNGHATAVAGVRADLGRVQPGNPQFRLSGSYEELAHKWQTELAEVSREVALIAERLHATAKAYSTAEQANVSNADVMTRALGDPR